MKFEHLLQLYWTKGYLFGGTVCPFKLTHNQFLNQLNGINIYLLALIIRRFEWNAILTDPDVTFYTLVSEERVILNMFLARLTTVNNTIFEWRKLTSVRLYLIRAYRGRCQAIGKPAHGQRTWSNAWTAYRYNKTIRLFIAETTFKVEEEGANLHKQIVKKIVRRKRKRTTAVPVKNRIFSKKRLGGLWM